MSDEQGFYSEICQENSQLKARVAGLERDLAANMVSLNEAGAFTASMALKLTRLESALKGANVACELDTPLPIFEVLEKSASWLGNLQNIHDCDCQVTELRLAAQRQSESMKRAFATINKALVGK